MKVILPTVETSGTCHYAAELVTALGGECDATIIGRVGIGRYVKSPGKVVEVPLPAHRYDPRYLWGILKMVLYICRQRPTIVHTQDAHPLMCLIALFIGEAKLVFTMHDVTTHPGDSMWYLDPARDFLVHKADAIIVHGDAGRNQFLKRFPKAAHKVHASFHPVRSIFGEWHDASTQERKDVLFFGRVVRYKGIDILLKAARAFHEAVPDYTITIAGSGDFSPYLPLLEHCKGYVKVDNRKIPDEEVARLFASCAFVVLPYIEASESGVLATSYYFRKPAIVTRVGSLHERVEQGRTGLVINPGDVDALAEAMIHLACNDAVRREMSVQIQRKVSNELNWRCAARRTMEIYDLVLRKSRAPLVSSSQPRLRTGREEDGWHSLGNGSQRDEGSG